MNYDEAVAVTREQLALAEHALKSLRRGIKNPRQFAVFSEGYIDHITALKADLRKYAAAAKRRNGKARKATPRQSPKSKSSGSLETFGGPYHHFESDFRDRAKPRSGGKQKKPTRRPRKAG